MMTDEGIDKVARKVLQRLVADYKIGQEPLVSKDLDDVLRDSFIGADPHMHANITQDERDRVYQKAIDIIVRATDREVNK